MTGSKPPTPRQLGEIEDLRRRLGRRVDVALPRSRKSAQRTIGRLQNDLKKSIGGGQGGVRRKSGKGGKRLTRSSAPSKEIRERQRKSRATHPVTTRWVDPAPVVKDPSLPATEPQLRTVAWLAERAGVPAPLTQTRHDASLAIGRLRAAVKQREGKDPMRKSRRATASKRA